MKKNTKLKIFVIPIAAKTGRIILKGINAHLQVKILSKGYGTYIKAPYQKRAFIEITAKMQKNENDSNSGLVNEVIIPRIKNKNTTNGKLMCLYAEKYIPFTGSLTIPFFR